MKWQRKAGMFIVLVAVMASVVGVTSAQDGRRGPKARQRDGFTGDMMALILDVTGLERQDIVSQLREGNSLAEIITSAGADVEAVKEEVIALITEKINTAVADGRLDQERADMILENLQTRVDDIFSNEGPLFRGDRGQGNEGRRTGRGLHLLQAVAEAAGLDREAMREQVSAGKTPAEILTEHGVDSQAFVDEQLALVEERLAEAVANERLTQEEADARLAEITERLNTWMNEPLSAPQQPLPPTTSGA